MKILIYGINYYPELVGIGKYTGEMSDWLARQEHEIKVVTAPPYYPGWQVWPKFSKWLYSCSLIGNLTVWRCPLFIPARPNTILRILHLVSFTLASTPILMAQIFWRPHIVFVVAPTLLCAPGALLLARLTGAKSILHIQDFEVDALFNLDLVEGNSSRPLLKRLALSFESLMLKSFDIVSTISKGMVQRALAKGVASDNIRFFPNWSDIDHFQSVSPSPILLQSLGLRDDEKIILYSGNMGEKQGLENIILAAQQLHKNKNLIFLIVGDGTSKSRLIKMAKDLSLTNIIFAPLQSYEDLPSLLVSVDVHLIIQRKGVADAVFPSKLTNILAVGGNVVITADASTTLGRLPIDHPGIALIVEPESIEALVLGIKSALSMPQPNHIAINYAKEYLDREQVLSHFFQNI